MDSKKGVSRIFKYSAAVLVMHTAGKQKPLTQYISFVDIYIVNLGQLFLFTLLLLAHQYDILHVFVPCE